MGGNSCIAPFLDQGPNQYRVNSEAPHSLRGFDLYFGHCGYETYQDLRDGHLAVTNFRDPVQRVHSIYRYWKYNVPLETLGYLHPGDFEVVRLAHDLSFSEFIRAENEDLKLYMSNFHFRQIYRSGWVDCGTACSATSTVKRRIRDMPWFYIAETPEASASLLRNLFPDFALRIPIENRSNGNAQPFIAADVEHLIRLNLLDYEIYAYALKLQSARLTDTFCARKMARRSLVN